MKPQTEEQWLMVLAVIERLYAEVRAGNWDGLRQMLHGYATSPPEPSAEPDAWMAEDGRVISGETKRGAVKDGGAIESGARPYCIPLYRRAPEPAGGHGNPCPLCKAHNLASCECPQEDHVDSVKVQPAFYRIQHKFDKGRFNDFSTDMWDLIIPGLPLTKEAKP